MSTRPHTPAAELLAEEESLRLDQVDEVVCHRIGSQIAQRSLEQSLTVTVAAYLDGRLVYKAALPGTNLSNDLFIEAKVRVASMTGHSSLWARNHYLDQGTTFEEATGLGMPAYGAYGGAVPLITAAGEHRGWIVVSGLAQTEDHALAVEAIRAVAG